MNPPNDVSSRHLCAPASLGHVVIGKDGWGLSVCLRVPRCEYLLHTGDGNRFQPREMGGGFRLSEWFLVPQSPESVHSMHRRWLEGILTSRGPSGPGLWTLDSGLWTLGKSWWTTLRSRSAFWWGSCSCCRSCRRTALAAGCGALVSSCSKLGPLVDEPRSSLHSPTVVINPTGGPCSSSILMIQLSSMPRQQAPEWTGRRLFEMAFGPRNTTPQQASGRPRASTSGIPRLVSLALSASSSRQPPSPPEMIARNSSPGSSP